MRTIDLGGRAPAELQGLLSPLAVPRPIAMISTAGPAGPDVAPFSCSMPVCGQPPAIDPTRVAAVGRMGSPLFVAATGSDGTWSVFEQERIAHADLVDSAG